MRRIPLVVYRSVMVCLYSAIFSEDTDKAHFANIE